MEPNRALSPITSPDLEYLYSFVESVSCNASGSLDNKKIYEIINRLGIAIATDAFKTETPSILEKDLKVLKTLLSQKKDWSEVELEDGLPACLTQGIATCINLLNPCTTPEIQKYPTYHDKILKISIANKDSSISGLTPRGCVRQYCLDILKAGYETYRAPLYLLRQSSSVVSGIEEKPNVIITFTKTSPPKSVDDLEHMIVYWHENEKVWMSTQVPDPSNTDKTWRTIDELLIETFPKRLGLYSPSQKTVCEYVQGYFMNIPKFSFPKLQAAPPQKRE